VKSKKNQDTPTLPTTFRKKFKDTPTLPVSQVAYQVYYPRYATTGTLPEVYLGRGKVEVVYLKILREGSIHFTTLVKNFDI